jgi:hypothetical protein
MRTRIIRHSLMAVWLAVLAVACNKSPTNPGGGNGNGNGGGSTVTVSSLAVTGDVTLSEGATSQLTATATMSDGTTQIVTTQATWSTGSTAVATVSSTGLLTAKVAGSVGVSAIYRGQTAQRTVQVSAAIYQLMVRAESVTATGTCDDITQGSGTGEFAIRMRVLRSAGDPLVVTDTTDYPGDANNLRFLSLSRNASLSRVNSRSFQLSGAAGQFVTVEFNATEWDTKIIIIPPRIDNVKDSDMNNRSVSRKHAFVNGAWDGIGSRSVQLGDSSCGIRLAYEITATKQ